MLGICCGVLWCVLLCCAGVALPGGVGGDPSAAARAAAAVATAGIVGGGGGPGAAAAAAAAAAAVGASGATAVAPKKEESSVLMVMNLPDSLTDDHVRELLSPFGELKKFNLLKDSSGKSKGTAVFEYTDMENGQLALSGLSGLPVGKGKLMVQRVPAMMAATLLKPVKVKEVEDEQDNVEPTCVVRLSNMVEVEELADDTEYAEIKGDVVEECEQYGKVKSAEVPRPEDGKEVLGLGEIFVEFEDVAGATKGRNALAGRKFGGKAVKATYYPLDLFQMGVFGKPSVDEAPAVTKEPEKKHPTPAEVQPGAEQGGAHGFVIVGEADDGPAAMPVSNGVGSIGDDDLPPDFDAMPVEAFETKTPSVQVATMEVD
ncbi:unnamed protein product [Ectocarpus sp. 6 AP-2014]